MNVLPARPSVRMPGSSETGLRQDGKLHGLRNTLRLKQLYLEWKAGNVNRAATGVLGSLKAPPGFRK